MLIRTRVNDATGGGSERIKNKGGNMKRRIGQPRYRARDINGKKMTQKGAKHGTSYRYDRQKKGGKRDGV